MHYKNIIVIILFILLTFPAGLLAQESASENKPVIIRKQLITEETIYQDIVFSGMTSIYVSPIFVSNYAIQQLKDNNQYNESHFFTPSLAIGADYRLEYNSYFIKTGLSFSWIKENKYVCQSEIASDTSFIDTASYTVNLNNNTQELVSAYYVYTTIPLSVGKTFTLGKFRIMPEAGVDFSFLVFASGYNGANYTDKIAVERKLLQTFIPQLTLSNTFAYTLDKYVWVSLCPWFNYSLKPLYKDSSALPTFKLSTYGIKLGIILK